MIVLSGLREWAYKKKLVKPVELQAFVVSVGNLSLGGTGKSAFVMWLAEWAAERRIPTVVLSRGYKRKTSDMRILGPGEALPDAAEIGDEPWMIKNRVPSVGLLVHADRARMAERHWAELGSPRLVLLDDAFQHWRSARNIDVVMVDATESLEQKTLPFGRLRESIMALRRADLVVITHAGAVSPESLERLEERLSAASLPRSQPIWKRATGQKIRIAAADYECMGFRDAATGEPRQPDRSCEYLLVSGIAKPDHLRSVVKRMGLQVREELYFPDHHRLSAGEITQIRKALAQLRKGSLLVTEKDWGRWRELFASGVPALVIQVRFAFRGRGPEELEAVLEEVKKGAGCFTLP